MTLRHIVEPGDTWGSLAYRYLGASIKFRDLLEVNPEYHELSQPRVGDVITVVTKDKFLPDRKRRQDDILPWRDINKYIDRLLTYTDYNLENIEECNGDTLSPAVEPYVPELDELPETRSLPFSLI